MANKLFVGSLPYNLTDEDLNQLFAEVGTVESAKVIIDRDSNRSKGFGFVEMANDEDSKKAIDLLNGKEVDGRKIVVNEARPMRDRGDRGGNNRNGGFGRRSF